MRILISIVFRYRKREGEGKKSKGEIKITTTGGYSFLVHTCAQFALL
jgi:hypothetical protein